MGKDNRERGFSIILVLIIVGAIALMGGVGYYAVQTGGRGDITTEEEAQNLSDTGAGTGEFEGTTMTEDEGVILDKDGSAAEYSGAVLAGGSSPLLDFVKTDYDSALGSDKLIVLYFYANWCPICRAEFPLMQAAFDDLKNDQVIGFRVNYNDSDTDSDEKALAKQFGVAYQHTKVFVKNGTRTLKAPDGWDKKRYLEEIAKGLGKYYTCGTTMGPNGPVEACDITDTPNPNIY